MDNNIKDKNERSFNHIIEEEQFEALIKFQEYIYNIHKSNFCLVPDIDMDNYNYNNIFISKLINYNRIKNYPFHSQNYINLPDYYKKYVNIINNLNIEGTILDNNNNEVKIYLVAGCIDHVTNNLLKSREYDSTHIFLIRNKKQKLYVHSISYMNI